MLTLGLIVIGGLLVLRAAPHLHGAPRAAGTVLALTAGGLILNAISVAKRHLALRPPVRIVACLVGAALLATLLTLRRHISTSALPAVPREDVVLRAALSDWHAQLAWLASAVAYVTTSVALLPPRPGAKSVTAHGQRQGGGEPELGPRQQRDEAGAPNRSTSGN